MHLTLPFPCQPILSDKPPSGPRWLHEIKYDGYRIIACRNGDAVRLWSRNGRDWSKDFLAVTDALLALKTDDIVLDGEAMAHCKDGLPDFFGLRSNDGGAGACLFAFDCCGTTGRTCGRCRLTNAGHGCGRPLEAQGRLYASANT